MTKSLLLFLLLFQLSWAQPGNKRYEPSKKFHAYQDDVSGKWGFRMVKSSAFYGDFAYPKFESIRFDFVTGVWIIENDSLFGCANYDGSAIVEPQFEKIIVNGVDDYCELTHAQVKKDGKWGLLGLDYPIAGKMIVEPQYGDAPIFKRGFVLTRLSDDLNANNWGIIDTTGKVIEPFIHRRGDIQFCIMNFPCKDLFNNEELGYYIFEDGKAAWFSMEAVQRTEYKYQSVCCQKGKFAIVQKDKYSLEIGIVDTTGKEVVPCEYEGIWYVEDSETILAYGIKEQKKYYFDLEGNITSVIEMTEKQKSDWNAVTKDRRNKKNE